MRDGVEILANLDRHAASPSLAGLRRVGGRSLLVGVGHARSVLAWLENMSDPDTLNSLVSMGGEPNGEDIPFSLDEEELEFPAWAAIEKADAIQASREFFRSDELPPSRQWQTYNPWE